VKKYGQNLEGKRGILRGIGAGYYLAFRRVGRTKGKRGVRRHKGEGTEGGGSVEGCARYRVCLVGKILRIRFVLLPGKTVKEPGAVNGNGSERLDGAP